MSDIEWVPPEVEQTFQSLQDDMQRKIQLALCLDANDLFPRDYVIWFLEQDAKRQKLSMRLLFASKRAGEANRAGQIKRADRMRRIIGRLYDRITELERD